MADIDLLADSYSVLFLYRVLFFRAALKCRAKELKT